MQESKIKTIANKHYGGQFTLLYIRGKWHSCFGLIDEPVRHLDRMASGSTLEECFGMMLEYDINAPDIMGSDIVASLSDDYNNYDVYL